MSSGNESEFVSNVSRFGETRRASSKIKFGLTSLMVRYISILIHHLLRSGSNVMTDHNYQNINLVVFGIHDLLRAKYQTD